MRRLRAVRQRWVLAFAVATVLAIGIIAVVVRGDESGKTSRAGGIFAGGDPAELSSASDEELAASVARAWALMLIRGAAGSAHGLLSSEARAAVDEQQFAARADDLAARAVAAGGLLDAPAVSVLPDREGLWVVTFAGWVEEGGDLVMGTFPVVVVRDETAASAGFAVELVQDAALDIAVVDGVLYVSSALPVRHVFVDGTLVETVEGRADRPAELAVREPIEPGEHTVTVIADDDHELAVGARHIDPGAPVTQVVEPVPIYESELVGPAEEPTWVTGFTVTDSGYYLIAAFIDEETMCVVADLDDQTFGGPCFGPTDPPVALWNLPDGTRRLVGRLDPTAARYDAIGRSSSGVHESGGEVAGQGPVAVFATHQPDGVTFHVVRVFDQSGTELARYDLD